MASMWRRARLCRSYVDGALPIRAQFSARRPNRDGVETCYHHISGCSTALSKPCNCDLASAEQNAALRLRVKGLGGWGAGAKASTSAPIKFAPNRSPNSQPAKTQRCQTKTRHIPSSSSQHLAPLKPPEAAGSVILSEHSNLCANLLKSHPSVCACVCVCVCALSQKASKIPHTYAPVSVCVHVSPDIPTETSDTVITDKSTRVVATDTFCTQQHTHNTQHSHFCG